MKQNYSLREAEKWVKRTLKEKVKITNAVIVRYLMLGIAGFFLVSPQVYAGRYFNVKSKGGVNKNFISSGAKGKDSIAIGKDAIALDEKTISLGFGAKSDQEFSTAIGRETRALGVETLAIGSNLTAKGNQSIAIGNDIFAKGEHSIVIGTQWNNGDNETATSTDGNYSVAIGSNSKTEKIAKNSVALGYGTKTTKVDAVALGSSSVADREAPTISGYDAVTGSGSTETNSVWKATKAAVSVGNGTTITRQITSVAAGSEDTDAVNVAQLKTAIDGTRLHYFSVKSNAGGNYNNQGATGEDAIAIGKDTTAGAKTSIAIGKNAKTIYKTLPSGIATIGQIAIGEKAESNYYSVISIGVSAGATGKNGGGSVYIGSQAGENGDHRTKGYTVWGSVYIGQSAGAETTGDASIGIGSTAGAYHEGSQNIYFGDNARTFPKDVITNIGKDKKTKGNRNIYLGNQYIDEKVLQDDNKSGYINDTIAFGTLARASQNQAIAIGSSKTAGVIGALADGKRSIAIGMSEDETKTGAQALQDDAVAIGTNAMAKQVKSTAIGGYASSTGEEATAIGYKANSSGKSATSIGYDTEAKGNNSVSIGNNTIAQGNNSLAIGDASKASTNNSIAIGSKNIVSGKESIAIGKGHTVSGENSGTFGDPNTISGNSSYAIGNNNTVAQDNTFVLGNDITTTQANSVILGKSSTDKAATSENSATVNGLTYSGFSGQGSVTNGVVSVGAVGKERQLINVAAGKISQDSTDAINGSQLYATNDVIGNVAKGVKNVLGGDAAVATNGDITMTNIGGTGKNTVDEAIKASKTKVTSINNSVKVVKTTTAEGADSYDLAVDNQSIVNNAKLSYTANDGPKKEVTLVNGLNFKNGDNTTATVGADGVVKYSLNRELEGITSISGGTGIGSKIIFENEKINMGGSKLTRVGDGEIKYNSKDGINGGQLHDVKVRLTRAGINFIGNTVNHPDGKYNVELGKDISIIGKEGVEYKDNSTIYSDENIATKISKSGKITIGMKKSPEFDTVTIKGADGAAGKDAVLGTDKDGNLTVINGTDGKDGKTPDIVLTTENAKLAYKSNGDTTTKKEVKLLDGLDFTNGDNTTATVGANGVVKYSLNKDLTGLDSIAITNGPTINTTGINMGGKKITNLANGDINATSKDAINGSQLHQEINNINTTINGNKIHYFSVNSTSGGNYNNDGAKGDDSIAIGKDARTTAGLPEQIAIGKNATTKGHYSIAIGKDSNVLSPGIAIGKKSYIDASGGRSIALGEEAQVLGHQGNAIGYTAIAKQYAQSIGNQTYANFSSVALGNHAKTVGQSSVGIGNEVINLTNSSVVIGGESVSAEKDGITKAEYEVLTNQEKEKYYGINTNNSTKARYYKYSGGAALNTVIGKSAKGIGKQVTTIGAYSEAKGDNSTAIGNSAEATKEQSVALGSFSKTETDAEKINNATVNNITYSEFAGDENVTVGRQVSVGKVGMERQIKHVAPGKISKDSTDVINGSQLYATNNVIGNVAKGVKNVLGGNAAVGTNGDITMTNIGGTGKDTVEEAIKASKTEVTSKDSSVTIVKTTTTEGADSYDLAVDNEEIAKKTKLAYKSNGDVATKEEVKLSDGLDFSNGDNTTATVGANGVVKYSLNKDLTGMNSISGGTGTGSKITFGDQIINVGGAKITNVGTPTDVKDAANKGYVDAGRTKVTSNNNSVTVVKTTTTEGADSYDLAVDNQAIANNTNLSYTANDGTKQKVTLAEGLNFKNGDNTTATVDANGVVKYDIKDKVTLGTDSKTRIVLDSTTGEITAGDKVTINGNTGKATFNKVTINGDVGTVNGLTNTTWNINNPNVVSGQAATEDQLKVVSDQVKHNTKDITNLTSLAGKGFNISADNGMDDNVKLGEKVNFTSSDKNIVTTVKDNEIDFRLKDNITLGETAAAGAPGKDGSIGVNGKDGSSVIINGKDGSIGLAGKNGENGLTFKSENGADGVDGTNGSNGKTRMVYEYKDATGTPVKEEVATLNDGMIFTGNNETLNKQKLNTTVKIVGEGIDKAASTSFESASGNINVNANGTDTLTVELAKDLKNIHSISNGDSTNDTKITLENDAAGDKIVNVNNSRITNVETPIDDGDAANKKYVDDKVKNNLNNVANGVNYVNEKVDKLGDKVNKGLAASAAMAGLEFMDIGTNQATVAAAVGGYRGTQAVAVGMEAAPTENTRVNAKFSITPGSRTESMYSVGASYRFNWK